MPASVALVFLLSSYITWATFCGLTAGSYFGFKSISWGGVGDAITYIPRHASAPLLEASADFVRSEIDCWATQMPFGPNTPWSITVPLTGSLGSRQPSPSQQRRTDQARARCQAISNSTPPGSTPWCEDPTSNYTKTRNSERATPSFDNYFDSRLGIFWQCIRYLYGMVFLAIIFLFRRPLAAALYAILTYIWLQTVGAVKYGYFEVAMASPGRSPGQNHSESGSMPLSWATGLIIFGGLYHIIRAAFNGRLATCADMRGIIDRCRDPLARPDQAAGRIGGDAVTCHNFLGYFKGVCHDQAWALQQDYDDDAVRIVNYESYLVFWLAAHATTGQGHGWVNAFVRPKGTQGEFRPVEMKLRSGWTGRRVQIKTHHETEDFTMLEFAAFEVDGYHGGPFNCNSFIVTSATRLSELINPRAARAASSQIQLGQHEQRTASPDPVSPRAATPHSTAVRQDEPRAATPRRGEPRAATPHAATLPRSQSQDVTIIEKPQPRQQLAPPARHHHRRGAGATAAVVPTHDPSARTK
jgi:hypothetical protein